MLFNTKLLHGKSTQGFESGQILPPISQVSAFRYESMEDLEKVEILDMINGKPVTVIGENCFLTMAD